MSTIKINSSVKTPLIKIGGNALTDSETKNSIISQVVESYSKGIRPIIVHGGGIEIKQLLDDVGIHSEFIDGHRKTDAKTMSYVEMALSGMVNKELVGLLNAANVKAVGISGKDAGMVKASKRYHSDIKNGKQVKQDLGFVGDVLTVDTTIINILTREDYVPVISPVSIGDEGKSYNINADMFAGHLAKALKTDQFIVLTNIDGLLMNIDDPSSLIKNLTPEKARSLFGTVVQGGMIPKIEACLVALEEGVESAHIINGTKKDHLLSILTGEQSLGTTIRY